MESISFRISRLRARRNRESSEVMSGIVWIFLLLLLGTMTLPDFAKYGHEDELIVWLGAILGAVILIAILLHIVNLLFGPVFMRPKNNFLQLDGDGLTYTNYGKSRHWRWRDLSAFKFKRRQASTGTRVLPGAGNFRRVDAAWRPRQGAYAAAISEQGDVCVIQDIYDTPLDEIAAKLNEYRERALVTDATQEPR